MNNVNKAFVDSIGLLCAIQCHLFGEMGSYTLDKSINKYLPEKHQYTE